MSPTNERHLPRVTTYTLSNGQRPKLAIGGGLLRGGPRKRHRWFVKICKA